MQAAVQRQRSCNSEALRRGWFGVRMLLLGAFLISSASGQMNALSNAATVGLIPPPSQFTRIVTNGVVEFVNSSNQVVGVAPLSTNATPGDIATDFNFDTLCMPAGTVAIADEYVSITNHFVTITPLASAQGCFTDTNRTWTLWKSPTFPPRVSVQVDQRMVGPGWRSGFPLNDNCPGPGPNFYYVTAQ